MQFCADLGMDLLFSMKARVVLGRGSGAMLDAGKSYVQLELSLLTKLSKSSFSVENPSKCDGRQMFGLVFLSFVKDIVSSNIAFITIIFD